MNKHTYLFFPIGLLNIFVGILLAIQIYFFALKESDFGVAFVVPTLALLLFIFTALIHTYLAFKPYNKSGGKSLFSSILADIFISIFLYTDLVTPRAGQESGFGVVFALIIFMPLAFASCIVAFGLVLSALKKTRSIGR